jgi:hypothetical protein
MKHPCDPEGSESTPRACASGPARRARHATRPGTEPPARTDAGPVASRSGRRLAALTTSALALPGIAGSARADTPIEEATAAASFSYYKEDNLAPSKFSTSGGTGSRDRYEVFTGQLRFDLPATARTDVGIELLYEEMSGASPWYVLPDSNGTPLQVMSGATIEDERLDLLVDTDFYLERGKDTISAGFSQENDYLSINVGLGTERNFNDKNTTLSVSGAFAYDWIDPTDPGFSTARPSSGERWSIDLFAGLSQILSRSSAASFTVNYKHSDGYLGDPYKAIIELGASGVLLSDIRPDTKDQVALLARYRHHFESVGGSAHLDYRFYTDDFGILSHTVDVAWYQGLFGWLTISPSFRWYTQSKADFYDTVLPAGNVPKHRSSDFRLSPYGAISYRIKAEVALDDVVEYDSPAWLQAVGITDGLDLIAAVSYERYLSDGAFSIVSVSESDEAPGLVDFRVFAFTLTGRF